MHRFQKDESSKTQGWISDANIKWHDTAGFKFPNQSREHTFTLRQRTIPSAEDRSFYCNAVDCEQIESNNWRKPLIDYRNDPSKPTSRSIRQQAKITPWSVVLYRHGTDGVLLRYFSMNDLHRLLPASEAIPHLQEQEEYLTLPYLPSPTWRPQSLFTSESDSSPRWKPRICPKLGSSSSADFQSWYTIKDLGPPHKLELCSRYKVWVGILNKDIQTRTNPNERAEKIRLVSNTTPRPPLSSKVL